MQENLNDWPMAVLTDEYGLPLKDAKGQDVPDQEARKRWWRWHDALAQWKRDYGTPVIVVRPSAAQLETDSSGYRPWMNAVAVKILGDMLGDFPAIKAGEARWAPLKDWIAQALLAGQPEQGATGDGEVERLRELLAEAIMYLRNIGDSASSSADCIGADLKRLEGKG